MDVITGPLADVYIRLDYQWNTTFDEIRYNRWKIQLESNHIPNAYNVTVSEDDGVTNVGIITQEEELNYNMISHYRDMIERGALDVDMGVNIRSADNVHVSSIILGKVADGPRPARTASPAMEYTILDTQKADELHAGDLEHEIRNRAGIQVDVVSVHRGVKIITREPTISRDTIRMIDRFIQSELDIHSAHRSVVLIAEGNVQASSPF